MTFILSARIGLRARTEIRGSGRIVWMLASDAADGAIFVYLEDVAPGQRPITRSQPQVEDPHKLQYEPLSAVPSSSLDEVQPLVPRKPVELKIPMWSTSLVVRKGLRLRIALTGQIRVSGDTRQAVMRWTVYRQRALSSCVDLRMRSR